MKNPFAFFTAFIFHGYTKEFKKIHSHRFIKGTKTYKSSPGKDLTPVDVLGEVTTMLDEFADNVDYNKIIKCTFKVKSGDCVSRLTEYVPNDIGCVANLPMFAGDVQSAYIDSVSVKVEYYFGVTYMSLNQSGDSEIYSI